jgi:aspartate aminotransferase
MCASMAGMSAAPASPTSTPAPDHAMPAPDQATSVRHQDTPATDRATPGGSGTVAPSASGRAVLSARVGGLAPSATLAVDAKAKALRAQGVDVVGFGAGEPDFPTPPAIVEAAVAACRDPRMHRYTPTAGLPELRAAIAAKTARDSGLAVEASQVLVTNGGKHAVANAFATLLGPGDEALLPAPYWTSYPELVRLAGAEPVPVFAGEERGFKVGVDDLEAARTSRTKLVVFVSPSNPTGAVYTEEEIAAIGAWAVEHGIWVVTDEIYEHLVYGGASFHSLPVVVPEAASRCVVLNGVAKTYAMTGWRVGWMIGPPEVVAAATNLQSQETSNVANVSQAAALAAVSGDLEAVATMRAAFDRRRRAMHAHLAAMPGVTCLEPEGAFYAFPCLEGLLGRPLDGPGGRVATTTAELAALALEEARVAFVPGEAFGAPGYGRFSYALADADLEEGMRRFAALAGRLAS